MAIGDRLECGSATAEDTERSFALPENLTGRFAQGQKLSLVDGTLGRWSKFEGTSAGFTIPIG